MSTGNGSRGSGTARGRDTLIRTEGRSYRGTVLCTVTITVQHRYPWVGSAGTNELEKQVKSRFWHLDQQSLPWSTLGESRSVDPDYRAFWWVLE